MKRFIDLREQDTGYNFAWWDTVKDRFETHNETQAWNSFEEFASDYKGKELERYRSIAPSWTKVITVEAGSSQTMEQLPPTENQLLSGSSDL